MLKLYGLKNCDTCKKAINWLKAESIEFEFIDIRNPIPDIATLEFWLEQAGDKLLINRRSTSWRNLTDEQKSSDTKAQFLALISQNPTLIKRPVFTNNGKIEVGFSPKNTENLHKMA